MEQNIFMNMQQAMVVDEVWASHAFRITILQSHVKEAKKRSNYRDRKQKKIAMETKTIKYNKLMVFNECLKRGF